jgi:hypothetical protein
MRRLDQSLEMQFCVIDLAADPEWVYLSVTPRG